jgi:hypothetical protein
VVPRGLRRQSETALPFAVRLRAERCGGPSLRCVPPIEGTTERALFVIDEQGLIYWSYLSPVGVNPGADGILEALESLSKRRVA